MSEPLISIIIPTHNRQNSVLLAIQSVFAQTYQNVELILVDDGSTDGTLNALKKYNNSRLRVFSIEHSGVSKARNFGVSQSQGGLIAFLDSDDIWQPQKLQKQIVFHRNHPELAISQTQEIWVRNGKRVNPKIKHEKPEGYIFPESLHLCTITPSSVLMDRELFYECLGFDENLVACEDYDLWLRITANHEVGLVDEALMTRYGGHDDQLSGKYEAMDRFRIYGLGKILLSGVLNEKQTQQVLLVLQQKTEIFLLGAKKRNRSYQTLLLLFQKLQNLEFSWDDFIQRGKELLLSEQVFPSNKTSD